MKHAHRIAWTALALVVLTGCGEDEVVVMPDVTDARLDLALSDIERAGFGDEVEVVGGGVFGVVDESNWVVCEQTPASGEGIGEAPRLVVDRSCDSGEPEEPQASEEPRATSGEGGTQQRRSGRSGRERGRSGSAGASSTFTMPPVVGMVLQDAQDLLQAQGSFFLTQTDATGAERFQVLDSGWKVCSQDPSPGASVDLTYMVDLGVVKLDEACP